VTIRPADQAEAEAVTTSWTGAPLRPDDAAAFARLSQELLAEPATEQTLQKVVDLAVQSIAGCDYAGATVLYRDRIETPAASDALVGVLDQYQYDLREGPCVDTARTEELYLIADTAHEDRWPTWSPKAASLGVGSVLSVQLTGPDRQQAALNLYSRATDGYDADAILTAQIYAMHASNAIATTSQSDNLASAMRARHVIGMAQGMLMLRYGLTETQAFAFLNRNSQDSNTKLRVLAARVVDELGQHTWSETP
jgi:GAF domain-containing protein